MNIMNVRPVMELRKFVSPEIVWGTDARLLISHYISNFGSVNPMIVTDPGVVIQSWFKDLLEAVGTRVDRYTIFDRVTPNPKDYEVMDGADVFLRNRCDLLIAVGGGSPMDCAKGISIVSTNGGNILDYMGVDKVADPGPPLICIPSTAGTSADVSQFAIILDTEKSLKKAIISKKVVPDVALIDPVPLLTADPYLTACTGMDALTHAVEAYVSTAHSDLTDVYALDAIKLISQNLASLLSSSPTEESVYPVMLGSLQAGLAFSNASLGAVHAMAHSLGGLLQLPHGECNSILLSPVIANNFDAAAERYTRVAAAIGLGIHGCSEAEIMSLLTNSIDSLRQQIGIQSSISVADFNAYSAALVGNAQSDPCMITNPKELTDREVRMIYEQIITAV
jgi:alcohol dehydrogenase class IV